MLRPYEITPSPLGFEDGEAVLLCHRNNGKTQYAEGKETFWRANLTDTSVSFHELDDEGEDVVAGLEIQREYQKPLIRPLGYAAYSGASLPIEGDWIWHIEAVPTIGTVNEFADKHLTPIGAHNLPLVTIDGEGADKEFRVQQIMRALAEGVLPIGTTPGYFHHDMKDHSVGMKALDARCMHALQGLAQLSIDMKKTDIRVSRLFAEDIASFLDYYSFDKLFAQHMPRRMKDPLLTSIVQYSAYYLQPDQERAVATVLRSCGYGINKNKIVIRKPEAEQYYTQVMQLLSQEAA